MSFTALHRHLQDLLGPWGTQAVTVRTLDAHFHARQGLCRHCEILTDLNADMLALLHRKGHLPVLPHLRHDHERKISQARVNVFGKRTPTVIMGERTGGVCKPLNDHEDKTLQARLTWAGLAHWRNLFHEAAHTVVSAMDKPLAHPDLDETTHDAIHRTVLGPMADPKAFALVNFEECFADAYAVMMLWRLAGPSDALITEIETTIALRQGNRRHEPRSSHHQTDLALRLAWDDRERWQEAPASALIQHAQRYASQGWWALFDPAQGEHGAHLWHDVLDALGDEQAQEHWLDLWIRTLRQPEGSRWVIWRPQQTAHPVLAHFDEVVASVGRSKAMHRWRGEPADEHRGRLCLALRCQMKRNEKARDQALLQDAETLRRAYARAFGVTPHPRPALVCPIVERVRSSSTKATELSFWERIFLAMGQARY